MSTVRIQSGAAEPIQTLIVDSCGEPLVGLTDIKVKIRRTSDGLYYDWSDDTFKAGPTQLLQAMSEVNATLSPGEYKTVFDTSLIVNKNADDTYFVTVIQDGVGDADNVPQFGEIKEGGFVDFIEQLYSLEMSFAYDPATDTLFGNAWLESRNLVVVSSGSVQIDVFDVDRNLQFSMSAASPDAGGVFKVSQTPTGVVKNRAYYAEATVTLPSAETVVGVKGTFTIG